MTPSKKVRELSMKYARTINAHLSMFLSISRGRANFRPKYICTSCLAHISPHLDLRPALGGPTREAFSTASIYCKADKTNASDATPTPTPKKKSPGRRRGRPAQPISHSRSALTALKESLVEEIVSETSKSKPMPKTKPKKRKNTAGEADKDIESANAEKAITGTEEENVTSEKAKPTTKSKQKPKSKKTTTKTPDEVGVPLAAVLGELIEAVSRPSKKPKAKHLTDAQRRKVDAVLLGAQKKRFAALSKKSNSQDDAISDNGTIAGLVKIIGDDKLLDSDSTKSIRKIVSKLRIRGHVSKSPIARTQAVTQPEIRAVFPNTPPPMVTQSLKEALSGAQSRRPPGPRHPSLIRAPPRAITRAAIRSPTKSRKERPTVTGPLTGKRGFEIKTLDAADLKLTPLNKPQPPVPNLSYGLDRVLFNPGVYHLQDPRSRVFNFDPYLETIMPVDEFDFNALKRYVTSSRDEALLAAAKEEKKKYTGSTSSMTAALAHFHFLLSQWRPINTGVLSQNFPVEYRTFTSLQRGPSAIFLKWKDGVYAIDADKQFDTANILSTLGKSMEKLLTLPTEDFEKYRKENSDQISIEEREAAEPFNYTTMGDFLMRSQLDAHDPRLPGTGMFDLKTRAVVSIRMDVSKYEQGRDYEIRQRYGEFESFEREYYDMIRAAFLKYSLQVRMGRMDGIFVAFHNTQRIFGFQYISQPEMDLALHGTEDATIGDAEFKLSLELLNKILDKVSAKYPEKSIRLHFETRDTDVPFMYIFAEPMEDERIVEIQESNKAVIEEFENRVLGLAAEGMEEVRAPEENLTEEERKAAEWSSMRARVEETMEKDELDLEEARRLAESIIESSDIFGSEEIPAEEKERLINDLLESSAFSEVEDEGANVSREDGSSEEDGVVSASAGSGVDDIEEEDDEGEEDDELEEDDEENEEEESEQDEDDQEDQGESNGDEVEGEAVEESDSLEQPEEKDLLIDEVTTNNFTKEPEVEAFDALIGPSKSVESLDEATESKSETCHIADNESAELDVVENKDLAPDKATMESDTHNTDSSPESTSKSNPETEDIDASWSGAEGIEEQDPGNRNEKEVLAMTLTIRNKVNGEYVDRPNKLTPQDKWTIEYALEDVSPHRVASLYQACKTRRAKTLNNARRDDAWTVRFMQNLWDLSQKGKQWRERQTAIDKEMPLKVLDWEKVKADQDFWAKKENERRDQTSSEQK